MYQLKKNVEEAIEVLADINELHPQLENTNKITCKFVLISLHALKKLSEYCNYDSPSNLLSIQQQQKIKILLQMVFSLGLTPFLLKGVNTPLKNKTFQLRLLNLEELSLIEVKYVFHLAFKFFISTRDLKIFFLIFIYYLKFYIAVL